MSELQFDDLTGALIGPKELGAILKDCAARTPSPVSEKYIRLFLFQPHLEETLTYARLDHFRRLAELCDNNAFWKFVINAQDIRGYTSSNMHAATLAFLLVIAQEPKQIGRYVKRSCNDHFANEWGLISYIKAAAEKLGRLPTLEELVNHYITSYAEYLPEETTALEPNALKRFTIEDWETTTFENRWDLMERLAYDLRGNDHYMPFNSIEEETVYPIRYAWRHSAPDKPPIVYYALFDAFFNRLGDCKNVRYDKEAEEQLRKLGLSFAGKLGAMRRITKPLEEFGSDDSD